MIEAVVLKVIKLIPTSEKCLANLHRQKQKKKKSRKGRLNINSKLDAEIAYILFSLTIAEYSCVIDDKHENLFMPFYSNDRSSAGP